VSEYLLAAPQEECGSTCYCTIKKRKRKILKEAAIFWLNNTVTQ
jgi:hypothetical protein